MAVHIRGESKISVVKPFLGYHRTCRILGGKCNLTRSEATRFQIINFLSLKLS